jgi:hypothetical protein
MAAKQAYLFAYNAFLCIVWYALYSTVLLIAAHGFMYFLFSIFYFLFSIFYFAGGW